VVFYERKQTTPTGNFGCLCWLTTCLRQNGSQFREQNYYLLHYNLPLALMMRILTPRWLHLSNAIGSIVTPPRSCLFPQVLSRRIVFSSSAHIVWEMTGKQHPIDSYHTYGWKPDSSLSEDVNFMDLVLLVTRSSKLRQGSMACILVRSAQCSPNEIDSPKNLQYFKTRIISVATNQSLYNENDSDIHAEITALGWAARHGIQTDACTAYITMPPCKRCFAALLVAGISRIVSRYEPPHVIQEAAQRKNVDIEVIRSDTGEQVLRIENFVSMYDHSEVSTSNGI
jgi:deoxycytidylate deaminase